MLETIIRELQILQEKVSEEQADRDKVAEHDNCLAFYRRQLKDMGITTYLVNYDMETRPIELCSLAYLVRAYVTEKIHARVKAITDNKAKAMLTENT
jgi:hypothetical protein